MRNVKRVSLKTARQWVILTCMVFFAFGGIVGYNAGKTSAQAKFEPPAPIETQIQQNDVEIVPEIEEETAEQAKTVYIGNFKLTAYCICYDCCGKTPEHIAYGITKSGTRATAGRTIAVDPNVIPLGTTVVIDGKEYIAEDTGKLIKGNRIDICFETHEQASKFGVQNAEVYVKC